MELDVLGQSYAERIDYEEVRNKVDTLLKEHGLAVVREHGVDVYLENYYGSIFHGVRLEHGVEEEMILLAYVNDFTPLDFYVNLVDGDIYVTMLL